MKQSHQLNPSLLNITECVIYARVSTKKQVIDGDGLNGQEKRCREFAKREGYTVLRTFQEKAISGGDGVRPAMQELLDYLDERGGEPIYVIIDDVKRFSRDTNIHFDLKIAILQRGGYLQSPNFKFGDTPEDKFIETIMAGAAELERNQNKRQVVSRMKARLEGGYWTFKQPTGFAWAEDPVHKKVLVVDEKYRHVIKEALEGYANNRFLSKLEMAKFLFENGFFGRDEVPYSTQSMYVDRMLRSTLYCGYLEYPKWGIELRKGHHEGIIALETFQAIQDKLSGKPVKTMRADTSADFLLRNFVTCQLCKRAMTASWTTKKNKKRYGYYHCQERKCPMFAKTIPKSELESRFVALLEGLEASDLVMDIARTMAERVWIERLDERSLNLKRTEEKISGLRKECENLTDKLALTSTTTAFRAIEERMVSLEAQREELEAVLRRSQLMQADFGTAFDRARLLIQNPLQTWTEGDLETKRLVIRLVFTKPIVYERGVGFGTADIALPYLVSARITTSKSNLVDSSSEFSNLYEWLLVIRAISQREKNRKAREKKAFDCMDVEEFEDASYGHL